MLSVRISVPNAPVDPPVSGTTGPIGVHTPSSAIGVDAGVGSGPGGGSAPTMAVGAAVAGTVVVDDWGAALWDAVDAVAELGVSDAPGVLFVSAAAAAVGGGGEAATFGAATP